MRFDGTIHSWNDERGFGFITPTAGGDDIFVHAKAFIARNARPHVGQDVTFEVERGPHGKKRAKAVGPPRRAAMPHRARARAGAASWGTSTLFAIPLFVLIYLAAAITWRVPAWVAGAYLAASVIAFLAYAADKAAARAGRWRTSEATLLFIGLLGGWPGAIVAQQVLRHKSSKASFRAAFWGTVMLNVVAFGVSASPLRGHVLSSLGVR